MTGVSLTGPRGPPDDSCAERPIHAVMQFLRGAACGAGPVVERDPASTDL